MVAAHLGAARQQRHQPDLRVASAAVVAALPGEAGQHPRVVGHGQGSAVDRADQQATTISKGSSGVSSPRWPGVNRPPATVIMLVMTDWVSNGVPVLR